MISDKMPGGYFVVRKSSKAVFNDDFRSLGAITAIPIGHPNPVTELSAIEWAIPAQGGCPNEDSIRETNCEDRAQPFVKTSLMHRDPGLRHPIQIRIRNTKRCFVNPPIAGQPLDLGRIGQGERSQDQSLSADGLL